MTAHIHSMRGYEFEFHSHGRSGDIRCSDGENVVVIMWEMSGSPDYDILLAPLDLGRWESGAEIPRDTQHRILAELRAWLVSQKIRSDAASPPEAQESGELCRRAGCADRALTGSAYCAFHYDESLLR